MSRHNEWFLAILFGLFFIVLYDPWFTALVVMIILVVFHLDNEDIGPFVVPNGELLFQRYIDPFTM